MMQRRKLLVKARVGIFTKHAAQEAATESSVHSQKSFETAPTSAAHSKVAPPRKEETKREPEHRWSQTLTLAGLQLQKELEVSSVDSSVIEDPQTPTAAVHVDTKDSHINFKLGDHVEGNYKGKGTWYPAIVIHGKKNSSGRIRVEWTHDTQNQKSWVKPTDLRRNPEMPEVGDKVTCKEYWELNKGKKEAKWPAGLIPGTVGVIASIDNEGDYTINFDGCNKPFLAHSCRFPSYIGKGKLKVLPLHSVVEVMDGFASDGKSKKWLGAGQKGTIMDVKDNGTVSVDFGMGKKNLVKTSSFANLRVVSTQCNKCNGLGNMNDGWCCMAPTECLRCSGSGQLYADEDDKDVSILDNQDSSDSSQNDPYGLDVDREASCDVYMESTIDAESCDDNVDEPTPAELNSPHGPAPRCVLTREPTIDQGDDSYVDSDEQVYASGSGSDVCAARTSPQEQATRPTLGDVVLIREDAAYGGKQGKVVDVDRSAEPYEVELNNHDGAGSWRQWYKESEVTKVPRSSSTTQDEPPAWSGNWTEDKCIAAHNYKGETMS